MKKINIIAVLMFSLFALSCFAQSSVPVTTISPSDIEQPVPVAESPSGGGGGGGGVLGNDFADRAVKNGLPIKSLGVLKAYARKRATGGAITISSPTIVKEQIRAEVFAKGADAVAQSLRSQRFEFEFVDPLTAVWVYAYIRDEIGYALFIDGKQTSFEESGKVGMYWLKDSSLKPKLVENPPILVPGLQSARIVITNKTGQIVLTDYLQVQNNRLFYPTNYLERNGDLFLTFRETDGRQTSKVFNLAGEAKSTKPAYGYFSVDLDGFYNFGTNPQSVELFGVDTRSAVVHFGVELNGRSSHTVKVGGRSSTGEMPIAFLYRNKEVESWYFWPLSQIPESNVPLSFNSDGEYELVYILTPEDLEGVPIAPPVIGKG